MRSKNSSRFAASRRALVPKTSRLESPVPGRKLGEQLQGRSRPKLRGFSQPTVVSETFTQPHGLTDLIDQPKPPAGVEGEHHKTRGIGPEIDDSQSRHEGFQSYLCEASLLSMVSRLSRACRSSTILSSKRLERLIRG